MSKGYLQADVRHWVDADRIETARHDLAWERDAVNRSIREVSALVERYGPAEMYGPAETNVRVETNVQAEGELAPQSLG